MLPNMTLTKHMPPRKKNIEKIKRGRIAKQNVDNVLIPSS